MNEQGHRFLRGVHPDVELAPRDVVSRAIQTELLRTGCRCVYLDATHLPRARLLGRFPSICRFLAGFGLDPSKDRIPVSPVAHYMIGGVTTDLDGRTSLPGLMACGEVAATGVHGANRLASNSLLEGLVFGERVARRLASPAPGAPPNPRRQRDVPLHLGDGHGVDTATTRRVRDLLWERVGIVRTGAELRTVVTELEALGAHVDPSTRGALPGPASNHVLLASLIARAALARTESRGTHYRSDYPRPVASWRLHLGEVGRPSAR